MEQMESSRWNPSHPPSIRSRSSRAAVGVASCPQGACGPHSAERGTHRRREGTRDRKKERDRLRGKGMQRVVEIEREKR